MADFPMQGRGPMQSEAQPADVDALSVGSVANIAGAVVSLALLAGMGVWGYKLMMRDVSGVPVVRSVEGPMRVQPLAPGGRPAAHQGLSVNSVAADGSAADPADRLVLAPPPIDIDDIELAAPTPIDVAGVDDTPALASVPAPTQPPSEQRLAIEALAEQIAASAAPLGEVGQVAARAPGTEPEPEAETATEVARVEGGLGRSLRPRARPDTTAREVVARDSGLENIESVSAGTVDVDPASIPAGTRLVQLGAFASADIARSEWAKLDARFSDYLDGKSRVIQRATSGGKVFFRLRAMGFADLGDARRFCSALLAEKADCIPVVTR